LEVVAVHALAAERAPLSFLWQCSAARRPCSRDPLIICAADVATIATQDLHHYHRYFLQDAYCYW
jgi:hypothetical protein